MSPHMLTFIAAAMGGWFITLVNRFAGLFVPLPADGSPGSHTIALLYLAALLFALMVLAASAARLPWRTGVLIAVGISFAAPMGLVLLLGQMRLPAPPPLTLTANNLFLPISPALVGAAVGRVIRHPNTLLAAAGFAIFFDLVVVTMGTVAQVRASGSNLIAAVSVGAGASVPRLPIAKTYPILSGVTIGPADVLFLALFLATVHLLPQLRPEWNLSLKRTFVWMFALLCAALALVELSTIPVPALVPMGIAVLIANARHAAFTRQEKRDLIIGAAFALLCAIGIIVGARRFAPTPQADEKVYGFVMQRLPDGEYIVGGIFRQTSAEKQNLRPGDVIERLGGIVTRGARKEAIQKALIEGQGAKGLTLRIRRPLHKAPIDLTLAAAP